MPVHSLAISRFSSPAQHGRSSDPQLRLCGQGRKRPHGTRPQHWQPLHRQWQANSGMKHRVVLWDCLGLMRPRVDACVMSSQSSTQTALPGLCSHGIHCSHHRQGELRLPTLPQASRPMHGDQQAAALLPCFLILRTRSAQAGDLHPPGPRRLGNQNPKKIWCTALQPNLRQPCRGSTHLVVLQVVPDAPGLSSPPGFVLDLALQGPVGPASRNGLHTQR